MLRRWNCRKQERLEFLYDSGLQVGKVAQADEYLLGKPLEEAVQPESEVGQVYTLAKNVIVGVLCNEEDNAM